MLKRSGTEPENPSKRIKVEDEMPPPSFVPRYPAAINTSTYSTSTSNAKPSIKFKLQTSIKDMKSHQSEYFSDDDEDDDDLWFKASQIEEQALQKNTMDLTYSDFHDAQAPSSTQNEIFGAPASQVDVMTQQRLRVLQNKCSALEKQLKRTLPNISKAQAQASQANCEVNKLKKKLTQLQTENEELKKEKLNEVDRVSTATGTIRNENDNLRQQVSKLEKTIRDSHHIANFIDKSPLCPVDVKNARFYETIFEEINVGYFNGVISRGLAFKKLKFDEGNGRSIFQRNLISLQFRIAEIQADFVNYSNFESFFSGFPSTFKCFGSLGDTIDASSQYPPDLQQVSTISSHRSPIDSSISVQPFLKFNNLKFPDKYQTIDFDLFNEITRIIHEISDDIRFSGLRHLDEHFVRQEFAFKQTQYCSDQYFGDKRAQKSSKLLKDYKNPLTKAEKLFQDEIRVDHRRLISIISILAGNSKNLSEMMMIQNISTRCDEYKTLIDVICETIDPHILQSRFLYKNSGITAAFTDLIRNLSIHYRNYEDKKEIINKNLEKFFSHLLAMSTNNPRTLLNFSEFLINILSHKDGAKFLPNLCINFPSSNLEYSYMFKIYQIPRCGCMLQIFFLLLTTAFRFIEDVEEHNLDILYKLSLNINTLVYLLIVNESDLKFLKPKSYEAGDSKSHCKCYMFLVIAFIILNNLALRHRDVNSNKYFSKISNITKSVVISLVALLSYTGQTIDYRSFTFGYNAINEIYTSIKYGDIFVDECDRHFSCADMILSQESHELFLDKIMSSTNTDFSYTIITYDSNPGQEIDETDATIRNIKDELWNEISESFKSDERELNVQSINQPIFGLEDTNFSYLKNNYQEY